MAKSKTKHLPAPDHAVNHWDDLYQQQLKGESDRATVILAAAILDSALESFLRTFLLPCSTSEDPLFDGANSPLSTFSSRIEMAYRLGLIDSAFARNLHLVRRIRNDFAHNVTGCNFEDASVVSRLTELRRSCGLIESSRRIRKVFKPGPRGDFEMMVSWMQWMIRSHIETTQALSTDNALAGHVSEYENAVSDNRKRRRKKPSEPQSPPAKAE